MKRKKQSNWKDSTSVDTVPVRHNVIQFLKEEIHKFESWQTGKVKGRLATGK